MEIHVGDHTIMVPELTGDIRQARVTRAAVTESS
jgi:hypothetical protein